MKKLGITLAAVSALLLTSSAASAQFCIVGIFAKAIYVGKTENRELTTKEALSCGLLTDEAAEPDAKKKKKVARAAKKN
jgi:hypothetical protein